VLPDLSILSWTFTLHEQDAYEEVDLITKGGNYGWRVYEGPYIYHPQKSPGGNTSLESINPIFPVMGYDHSTVNKEIGSASITGGYVYRGSTDPCLYGRYVCLQLLPSKHLHIFEVTPSSYGLFCFPRYGRYICVFFSSFRGFD
jgi:hypothetical protein